MTLTVFAITGTF